MADTKFSAMPTASTLTGGEIIPLVQSAANKQNTVSNILNQGLAVTELTTLKTDQLVLPGLTGYLYGNDTSAVTAATSIPANKGGTGITTYAVGDTLYGSATNTLAKLSGNTTTIQKFLTQTGTGSASAAPIWKVLSPSDINTQYGAFHFDYTTTLTSTINGTVQTIPVVSTTGFSSTGAIIIGNEIITYTGITSTSFTGCTRGVNNSANGTHTSGSYVGGAQTAAANTATLLQINTVDLSNGVSLNIATNELSVAIAGTYNIAFSAQFLNTGNSQDLSNIWFALDGVNVASSASWATTAARAGNTPGAVIMAANLFLTLTTSNKLTMKWLTTNGDTSIVTYPPSASPAYPSAPAVIVTVNQVS
jgi:hypothetical protein